MFYRMAAWAIFATALYFPPSVFATIVRMETTIGGFNIELYDTDTPLTVTNFLNYVGRGDASNGGYDNTFIHRSEPGFVIQGGGFFCPFGSFCHIQTDSPITNEYSPAHPNTRGTISMALNSDQSGNPLPNSATSEWFINLADNSANLAGYTVFGQAPAVRIVVASLDNQPLGAKESNRPWHTIHQNAGSLWFAGC